MAVVITYESRETIKSFSLFLPVKNLETEFGTQRKLRNINLKN